MRSISTRAYLLLFTFWCWDTAPILATEPLPKIRIAPDGRSFVQSTGQPFRPFGVTYYRPGTGWAPQVWKQFDPEATRADFVRMKELGVNCVRVFLSYGSFFNEPGELSSEGIAKFDQFLNCAEAAGIYVHPTGLDHWEGIPGWAARDRVADEPVLRNLETFWKHFAARYRGRTSIFAYDLRNEPEVAWDNSVLHPKWNRWLEKNYATATALAQAWEVTNATITFGQVNAPAPTNAPRNRVLLDYQLFRESVADEWTERQATAIKAADPDALVTVGLIQWAVPALLPRVSHYAGFRPERQARFLDFLEIHFYPFADGFYEYASPESEARNLAYLESVVREVAKAGKPVVVAEFGWYGGGKLGVDQGKHPAASEEQQARWCAQLVKTTADYAVGWLNWGFFDQPEAHDVSQLTGLITADGKIKAWGASFRSLSANLPAFHPPRSLATGRPPLDWDLCLTSVAGGNQFREAYWQAFRVNH